MTWNFGDGHSGQGLAPQHTYTRTGQFTATIKAKDSRGASTTASAIVTITPNRPPIVSAGGPYSGTVGQRIQFAATASDPDGDPLLVLWSLGDGHFSLHVSPSHRYSRAGQFTAKMLAIDIQGAYATASATVTIGDAAPPNRAPSASGGGPYSGTVGHAITVAGTASDPDGDSLMATWNFGDGSPSVNGLQATHTYATAGTYTALLTVSDGRGGTASANAQVTVNGPAPTNHDPSITSSPVTAAIEGQPYTYDVEAADADAGDALSYELTLAPNGMTIDASTGVIAWTPAATDVPSAAVTVRVQDGNGGADSQAFTIAVSRANRSPRIDSVPVTTAREQVPYSYQVHATDPNGDRITYALTTGPSGMTVDPTSGLVSWTPPAHPPSSVHVVVAASDESGASDVQAFDIAVASLPAANQPPRITSAPVTAGEATESYVYDVQANDGDAGDVLTFSLAQAPPGMTIAAASGLISWTPSATETGLFTVTVRVSDGKESAQQAYELTIAGQQTANRPPVAHAGGPYQGEAGAAIAFNGTLSSDPDNDALSFSWSFGDGSGAATGEAPSHIYSAAGSFVVTLTVTDGHGGESVRSTTVSIGAAGDRSPPSVTVLGPREVLPGDQITLTALAQDNVKVDKVTFEVDGANPTETTTAPFQRSIAVPPIASPGTAIRVTATATDPSGNMGSAEATLTITAQPDTMAPAVTLNAPSIAAPGATIHLSAAAADNSGIQSVGFTVNGAPVITLTEPPYEASYDIPAGTPIGATLTLGAFAVDFSVNRSDATVPVTIVETPDTQPPAVILSAAATTVPGAMLSLSATAADSRGVSAVAFYVDGVKIATDTQAPYSAAWAVDAGAQVGRFLQLEARAIDFAGLEGTDSRQTQIVSTSSLGQGVIAGEVYDNATGLPVDAAVIALTGTANTGQPYTQTTTSDHRGRYLMRATEGGGVLHIARAGWTRVDRRVEVAGNQSVEVFDARITPLSPANEAISAVLGGTASGPSGSQTTLRIPPGGLTSPAPVAVTPIGPQGLQGMLPAGWSPVATVDVTPHAVSFAVPATLSTPNAAGAASGSSLVLVRWDEATSEWRAVGPGSTDESGLLTAAIDTAGQYAWLLADTSPAAPPTPAVGAAVSGVAAGPIPSDATTRVLPQSKVVFYQPGVRADVTGAVTATSPVSSGSVIFTRISESYRFTSGLHAHVDPFNADLVLYQAGSSSTLHARYTVTPSIAFEPIELQSGVITVELFESSLAPRLSGIVGASGGSVAAATGERVDVPANALTTPAQVSVSRLAVEDLGFELPSVFAFAGGLTLSAFGAQFTSPVTLSIPNALQAPAGSQILIARMAGAGTSTRLVLVARGVVAGNRLESSIALGETADAFEGARVEGRYLFLRPASPVGFATGLVRAVNGAPFAGALVSADTLPLFALSRSGGEYVAAASIGAASLVAQDLSRNDTGSAQGSIAVPGASCRSICASPRSRRGC